MAIEITTKPKIKKILLVGIFLVLCIILILGLGLSYFYFDKSSKDISQKIQEKNQFLTVTPSEQELEQKVSLYQAKISTFSKLLSAHKNSLNIFKFLEENCHPRVWFSNFNLNVLQGSVTVSGQADGFVALGQQLFILKQSEILKKAQLSNITMSEEGEVGFTFQLDFNPQIFAPLDNLENIEQGEDIEPPEL